jgi:hypothetical protein
MRFNERSHPIVEVGWRDWQVSFPIVAHFSKKVRQFGAAEKV